MATGETGFDDVTYDLVSVQYQDSQRALRCHEFLRDLGGIDNTSPQGDASEGADPNASA